MTGCKLETKNSAAAAASSGFTSRFPWTATRRGGAGGSRNREESRSDRFNGFFPAFLRGGPSRPQTAAMKTDRAKTRRKGGTVKSNVAALRVYIRYLGSANRAEPSANLRVDAHIGAGQREVRKKRKTRKQTNIHTRARPFRSICKPVNDRLFCAILRFSRCPLYSAAGSRSVSRISLARGIFRERLTEFVSSVPVAVCGRDSARVVRRDSRSGVMHCALYSVLYWVIYSALFSAL